MVCARHGVLSWESQWGGCKLCRKAAVLGLLPLFFCSDSPPFWEGKQSRKQQLCGSRCHFTQVIIFCLVSCWCGTGIQFCQGKFLSICMLFLSVLFLLCFRTLHFALLNLLQFLWAHFSSLSRSSWAAARPSGILASPPRLLRVLSAPSPRPLMRMLNRIGLLGCLQEPDFVVTTSWTWLLSFSSPPCLLNSSVFYQILRQHVMGESGETLLTLPGGFLVLCVLGNKFPGLLFQLSSQGQRLSRLWFLRISLLPIPLFPVPA